MKTTFTILLCVSLSFAAVAQEDNRFKPDPALVKLIDQNLKNAAAQYQLMIKILPADRFPQNYNVHAGKIETSDSEWWCSGFYPGTLLYLNEHNKNKSLNREALRMLKLLEKEQYNKGTHDLGFMMFCSFGNANRIHPKPEYQQILINSAKSLSSRFNPQTRAIKSWNSSKPTDYLVIIDNMMNLELLFWATKVTGDSSYYKLATTHANTTMANHFRQDNSSYHVINYNPETGEVQQKKTAQGAADESAWARGQAWGLYGYTLMYRETKDRKYLDQAVRIADFILAHPNLPEDKIPYWDFNAPGIPNALRDVSAATIISSALLELGGYADQHARARYFDVASTIIKNLSSAPYVSIKGANGGFILQHSVGHFPNQTEVDVPISYADYYYVEAMMRYKRLANGRPVTSLN